MLNFMQISDICHGDSMNQFIINYFSFSLTIWLINLLFYNILNKVTTNLFLILQIFLISTKDQRRCTNKAKRNFLLIIQETKCSYLSKAMSTNLRNNTYVHVYIFFVYAQDTSTDSTLNR